MSEVFDKARKQLEALHHSERAGHDTHSDAAELRSSLQQLSWQDVANLLIATDSLEGIESTEASLSCVHEIQSRRDPEIFEFASRWCRAPEFRRRCYGATILGELNSTDSFPYKHQALPILEELLDDPRLEVVNAALFALGRLDRDAAGDVAKITRFCGHPESETRFATAFALTNRSEPNALAGLIALSTDADEDVRDWATFGLGSMTQVDTPEIRDALAARLDDPHDDTRNEAIKGLALRRDPRVVAAILAELPRTPVGSLVFEACAVAPDARYVELLEGWAGRNPGAEEIAAALEACRTGVPNERYR